MHVDLYIEANVRVYLGLDYILALFPATCQVHE